MTKRDLIKRRDEISYEMIEADGNSYYELQIELDEIEQNLLILEEMSAESMEDIQGWDNTPLKNDDDMEAYFD